MFVGEDHAAMMSMIFVSRNWMRHAAVRHGDEKA
jgi:hypothetical protein